MNRYISLFVLGIIVVLMPLSGFPIFWKGTFEVLAGLGISVISGLMYREFIVHGNHRGEKVSPHQSTYVENQE